MTLRSARGDAHTHSHIDTEAESKIGPDFFSSSLSLSLPLWGWVAGSEHQSMLAPGAVAGGDMQHK